MKDRLVTELSTELESFRQAGTMKEFHGLQSPQDALARMAGHGEVLILSSNNYLGLSNHPQVVEAGIDALRRYGAGTGSVRFICGTFEIHGELEHALAEWVGVEAALSFVSCWTANEGLIPTIAGEGALILSDELNHASIIDACRLVKAKRMTYRHGDAKDLREKLRANAGVGRKIVITDGVFSMEGDLAPLPDLVEVCQKEEAVLVMDDSHGTGVLGKTGRGTAEHFNLLGQVDVITSTLGKALGGAAGGFVAGPKALIGYLEQKSRTQLFTNALPPTVAGSAREALRQLQAHPEWVCELQEKTRWFRQELRQAGFAPLDGESAIVPVIVGDTARAIRFSREMLKRGIFVTGFGYPVVPEGKARIRIQISAAHTREQLARAVRALAELRAMA
ncbi:MAG: glycine C-acetyltransferase [Verrucomicrobiae bacterium]|nr:glycine C-acetyltransferase [Verrucomicrobiae bacterium]